MKILHSNNQFEKARLMLTSWYVIVLLILVLSFSTALYITETGNFTRIILRRQFGTNPPAKLTTQEKKDILSQASELKNSFIRNLILIDLTTLLAGGGLSYFLAGKTLKPIQLTLTKQKEFIADASHELRTPLTAIQTTTEVALRYEDKSPEEYKKIIVSIKEESLRLGKLVEDLLTITRIDSGLTTMKPREFNLSEIVDQSIFQLESLIDQKKIILKKNIEPNLKITADPDRIKQIIIIILDNALKFTSEQGKINISLTHQSKITLMIQDTGIGISDEDQKRIFERFFQSDKSRVGNSSGLGLAIAKQLAEKNNIEIAVSSKLEKGTIFTLQFKS